MEQFSSETLFAGMVPVVQVTFEGRSLSWGYRPQLNTDLKPPCSIILVTMYER